MASLDFFATREDLYEVFKFLFARTDFHVFESYSDFDKELREFRTPQELLAGYDYEFDPDGLGNTMLLQLWSPKVTPGPVIQRIEVDPRRCAGLKFRYCVEGFGVVQFYLGGVRKQSVIKSHFGHFSERGARRKGYAEGVDWEALEILSGWVRGHISRALAVAKAPGRPVLAGAYEKFLQGCTLIEFPGHPAEYHPLPRKKRRVKSLSQVQDDPAPRSPTQITRHKEMLARTAAKDAQLTKRRCPTCGQPCPTYRRTCKHCGHVIGRST